MERERFITLWMAVAVVGAGWVSVSRSASAGEISQRLYRSAYYLGRGDTGISVAKEEEAIFYNPAGLALGDDLYKKTVLASPQIEVSQSTKDLARQLAVEKQEAVDTVRRQIGKPNHLGWNNLTGLILRRAALGVFASGGADLMAYKSPEYGGLEAIDAAVYQNAGLTFSLAESFWDDTLLIGATTKYLMRAGGALNLSVAEADKAKDKLSNTEDFTAQGEGGGADLGAMLRLGGRMNPNFGLTISNVGDTRIIPEKKSKFDLDLKQTVNVGASISPGTRLSKFRLLADYRDVLGRVETNWRKRLSLGAELTVGDIFGFTSGLHHGYPSLGFYTDLYFARLDLGMYTQEVGERVGTRTDQRYFVRIETGF